MSEQTSEQLYTEHRQSAEELNKADEELGISNEFAETANATELQTAHDFLEETGRNFEQAAKKYYRLIVEGLTQSKDPALVAQAYEEYNAFLENQATTIAAEQQQLASVLEEKTKAAEVPTSLTEQILNKIKTKEIPGGQVRHYLNMGKTLYTILHDESQVLDKIEWEMELERNGNFRAKTNPGWTGFH